MFALLLSFVLHWTVLSGINGTFWESAKDAPPQIEAHLIAATKGQVQKPPRLQKSPKVHAKQPVQSQSTQQESPSAAALADAHSAVNAAVADNVQPATETNSQAPETEISEPVITVTEEPLPTPYQTVDTTFDLFVNGEKRPSGTASIQFRAEAGQYKLRWEIQGRGLLRLFYPQLVQESAGEIGSEGLRPVHYRYAFGSKVDKTYEADFNWSEHLITLKTSKGEFQDDLPMHTQDILSFMYQFMYIPPLQEMRVTLTNGKRLGVYQYSFEGEEVLELAGQSLNTIHIGHSRGDTDEKVEIWLATDYRNLPVKIRKTEKNGTVIDQMANRLIAE